jgi:hypothetical protein
MVENGITEAGRKRKRSTSPETSSGIGAESVSTMVPGLCTLSQHLSYLILTNVGSHLILSSTAWQWMANKMRNNALLGIDASQASKTSSLHSTTMDLWLQSYFILAK